MSKRLALSLLFVAVFSGSTTSRASAQDVPPAAPVAPADSPVSPPPREPLAQPAAEPPPPPPHHHHDLHHDHEHGRCGDCMPRPPRGDFMPAVFFGAGMFELTGLNDRLARAGYERLDNLQAVIGGEVRVIHPSGLLTSVYGAAILPNTGDGPERLRASWNGGFGMLDVGWAFIDVPAFTLSLSGGVGGYWASVDIAQRGEANFDSVLANPRRGTTLNGGGLLFGAVLRADGRIPLGAPLGDRQGYLAIGLRVTALLGPGFSDWDFDANNSDVNNGPAGNLAGVYAAVVIGWGGTSIHTTP